MDAKRPSIPDGPKLGQIPELTRELTQRQEARFSGEACVGNTNQLISDLRDQAVEKGKEPWDQAIRVYEGIKTDLDQIKPEDTSQFKDETVAAVKRFARLATGYPQENFRLIFVRVAERQTQAFMVDTQTSTAYREMLNQYSDQFKNALGSTDAALNFERFLATTMAKLNLAEPVDQKQQSALWTAALNSLYSAPKKVQRGIVTPEFLVKLAENVPVGNVNSSGRAKDFFRGMTEGVEEEVKMQYQRVKEFTSQIGEIRDIAPGMAGIIEADLAAYMRVQEQEAEVFLRSDELHLENLGKTALNRELLEGVVTDACSQALHLLGDLEKGGMNVQVTPEQEVGLTDLLATVQKLNQIVKRPDVDVPEEVKSQLESLATRVKSNFVAVDEIRNLGSDYKPLAQDMPPDERTVKELVWDTCWKALDKGEIPLDGLDDETVKGVVQILQQEQTQGSAAARLLRKIDQASAISEALEQRETPGDRTLIEEVLEDVKLAKEELLRQKKERDAFSYKNIFGAYSVSTPGSASGAPIHHGQRGRGMGGLMGDYTIEK